MTPTQFSAKTRNVARETGLNPQLVQRHYMMDKFLEKIAESSYQDDFVLKGGFLLGSKYGISTRSTIDIDTTVRRMKVTEESISKVFNDLVKNPTKEGIKFEIKGITETREADFYPGFQVKLLAHLENTRVPFKMDITTGDSILPGVEKHKHKLMFEDKSIEIPAYPTEQIIAEKLSATVNFGVDNSRAKDYYDLYTIPKFESINQRSLYKSVRNTFTKRGNLENLETYYNSSIGAIENSSELKTRWEKYQEDNPFAKGISYEATVDSIKRLMNACIDQERIVDQQKKHYQFKQSREMER